MLVFGSLAAVSNKTTLPPWKPLLQSRRDGSGGDDGVGDGGIDGGDGGGGSGGGGGFDANGSR